MIADAVRPDQKRDWFLIGIIIGITVLVATTVVLILNTEEITYLPEGEADNVAFNYFLALKKGEDERAYQYLSTSLENYPANEFRFVDDLYSDWMCDGSDFERKNYSIIDSKTLEDRVRVELRETIHYGGGDIFNSGSSYSDTFTVTLVEEPAGWRIVDSERCWAYAWNLPLEAGDNSYENG